MKIRLTLFKQYLQQLGYQLNSQKMFYSCVKEFLEHQQISHLEEVRSLEKENILTYKKHLETRPHKRNFGALSESYIHHHLYSLRVFFLWLEKTERISSNPMSGLRFKTPESKERTILSKIEVKKLYEVCETYSERTLLHLFYACGLRRSEAESLQIKDVQMRKNLVFVRSGKHGKRRVIPITEKIKREFQKYYYQERKANEKEQAFVVNKRGNRKRGDTYRMELKKLLERAGLNTEISLHHLRHSIATHLLEEGMSVEFVRDFLGHESLETTQIYTRVNKKQIAL